MFKVIMECAFDMVYTVAKGLDKLSAIELARHVEDMTTDCEMYDWMGIKEIKVVKM